MQLDLETLLATLSKHSEDSLNAILDSRDAEPFDTAWCQLSEIVGGDETHPDAEAIFIRISEATHQHEITSYIADDIDLLFRSERKEIDDPFLEYLRSCYAAGTIPSEWDSI
jgi:hypothetical protein